jgi:hypothetical protein
MDEDKSVDSDNVDEQNAMKSKDRVNNNATADDEQPSKSKVHNNIKQRRVIKADEKNELIAREHNMAHRSGRNNNEVLRAKFYWRSMYKDILEFASRCRQCQQNQTNIKAATQLRPIAPPQAEHPFAMWGVDLVGPLKPSDGHRFCVCQNYVQTRTLYDFK